MFGRRKSITFLRKLCKTNRNGTTTQNMIMALTDLGLSVLVVEYATLRHVRIALKSNKSVKRAVIVSYLLDDLENSQPEPESGHWAMVSGYSSAKNRIYLLDSSRGQRRSYAWSLFRKRWFDYDLKRRKLNGNGRKFQLVRRWQPQLLMTVAENPFHLPKFRIPTQKLFLPV